MFETHKLNEKGFKEMKAFKTEASIFVSKWLNKVDNNKSPYILSDSAFRFKQFSMVQKP